MKDAGDRRKVTAMHEGERAARYYRKSDGGLRCELCPQFCNIQPGKTGICRTRRNEEGRLILTNYGRFTSMGVDPIEKKPLYHFCPGSGILSIGGKGCNFVCRFCQNWHISHEDPVTRYLSAEELSALVADHSGESIGIAFTYNEPMIWFEYILDAAPLIRQAGGKIALVTNGYINPEPLEELLPHVDAMNIDLKAFNDAFYRKFCGGRVEPVKETIVRAARAGVWVEITCLLIPNENDSDEEVRAMTEWIASVGKDIPFHLSRYFPNYKMESPPTPTGTLKRAYEIAKERLHHVYLGNVAEFEYGWTHCPSCKAVVIERHAWRTVLSGLTADARCAACKSPVALAC